MTSSSRLSALCDKIIEAGWLAAVVLVPLFFNVYSSRVFEPDKLTLLRSIALVMIGAWIVRWLEERGQNRDREDRITRRTPLVLPTLILIVVYLISSVFSLVPRVSFMGSYQRLQGTYTTFSYIVVFWMIIQHMRRKEQLDRIITVIVMTSLPIAFYGLLQRGDGKTTLDPLPWGGNVTSRVAANMGNAIFVAAYLIMAFFLTLGRVVESFRIILAEEESRLSDILRASGYVFVGAVQMIAFAFADSRGPLLGWLPGIFVFALVGLLLMRVMTHGQASAEAAKATGAPDPAARHSILAEKDVLFALLASILSVGLAAGSGLLVYASVAKISIFIVVIVALIAGLVPLLVIAGVWRQAVRWLWLSWILFSIIGALGIFVINFSDHPWVVQQREKDTFGALGTLFESGSGSGRVRALIWQGSIKLIEPHAPIEFPNGTTDSLNAIRPLIGYGPESMYVAYNSFYPPDLAHYEARNASPDRSHNETLDSFVITGLFGFLAEQFLYISVFFLALKSMGWIPNRKAAITFVGMTVAGGIAGAAGIGILKGTNFMGAGWPGGVTVGIVLYLVYFALFHFQISTRVYAVLGALLTLLVDAGIFSVTFTSSHRAVEMLGATAGGAILFGLLYLIGRWAFSETAGQPIEGSGHIFLIAALFAGVLAHYLEISLAGIAIAATNTYFWTFAGLLVVLGLRYVPADEPSTLSAATPAAPTTPAPSQPTNVPRRKKKSRRAIEAARASQPTRRTSSSGGLPRWFGPTLTLALLGALILMTLGYEFINKPPIDPNSPNYIPITNSTQLIVASLTRLPYQGNRESSGALLMFTVTWLFGGLLSLTELRRRGTLSAKDVLPATATYFVTSLTIALVFWLILAGVLMGVGSGLTNTQSTTIDQLAQRVQELVSVSEYVANVLVLFYVAVFGTIIALAGSMLISARTWFGKAASDWGLAATVPVVLAVLVGISSTNLSAIRADTIYKQVQPYSDAGQWDVAIAEYKKVVELQPDEDYYYLWLGAAYLAKATNAQTSNNVLVGTSNLSGLLSMNFQQTYTLSRDDSLNVAKAVLEHARDLNPLNTDHTANLARMYQRWAELSSDPATKKDKLETSAKYYQEATTLSPQNAILWNQWATVYLSLYDMARQANDTAAADANLKEAQARLDHSLSLDTQFDETYVIRAQLANVLGQPDEAQKDYELALKWNPNNTNAWNGMTQQLLSTGNYTEVETTTLAFLKDNPDYAPALRTLARSVYYPQHRLDDAIVAEQHVITSTNDANIWDDHRVLAILLAQTGRLPQALQEAQTALQAAPQANQADIQTLIDQLQAQLNISPGPTTTVPGPAPAPAPTPAP